MLQLLDVRLAFGGQQVLDGVTWTITPGQRIGLIGPNGAGKTTLLRVISGEQPVDGGQVETQGDIRVGYLRQDTQEVAAERTVIEEALEAFEEVQKLQAEEDELLDALERHEDHESEAYHKLLDRLGVVHAQLATREAHRTRPQAEAILTGLGFDPDDLERPLRTFSGGWRMRVALAKLLLQRPDVLLLDEPTNHLDIDSIDWLEGYLKNYGGTVIIVSHDRYFLDRMVNVTAELSRGIVTVYAGNYAFYLEERQHRRELQRAAYENQQKMIADTERFIERFRAKATKANQVQSRVKALEKLERVPPPPDEEAAIRFRFPEPKKSGRVVLDLSTFSKTYYGKEGDVEVFDDAGPLQIERGDKVALIGRNGAGKSTLVRMIGGTEPFEGTRTLGHNVELTYFAQHQADSLDPSHTVFEAVQQAARGHSETEIRSILGAFLFTGDDVFKPVGVLSGGERSRVALAKTLLVPANFLLLDEPTNHLDIHSINVLVEALRQFTGTFCVVSHDRHFLDRVANKVWRVEHGGVRTFFGNYSDYLWQVEHGTASRMQEGRLMGDGAASAEAAATNGSASGSAGSAPSSSGPKTKEQKRQEAEERNRRYQAMKAEGRLDPTALTPGQLRKEYRSAEAAILEKETRKEALEAALGDPDLYTDEARAKATTAEYEAVKSELAGLYEQWEALAEQLAEQEA